MSSNNILGSIFSTDRLVIRPASPKNEDVDFLYELWTNPLVMKNVGFPRGLKISRSQVIEKLESEISSAPFDCRLMVIEKGTNVAIGEAKLGRPNSEKIAETDVKLHPEYWGNKYRIEIKQGLIDYLFKNTDCIAIKATPNKNNHASIKMQEAVGGIRLNEFKYEFQEHMIDYTTTIYGYVYLVTREDWEKRNSHF